MKISVQSIAENFEYLPQSLQMAFHYALFGDSIEHVLSWLDAPHLGRIEAAGKEVSREVTTRCWEGLANLVQERSVLEWRPGLLQTLHGGASGKELLKALPEIRKYLIRIPEHWSPQIVLVSPSSLKLHPFGMNAVASSSEAVAAAPLVPPGAVLPLALGIAMGEEMSVGIQIESEDGCANEGVWLGLEMHDGWGTYMSVRCEPVTGRCMVKCATQDVWWIAQVMDPLAHDHMDSVEVYVTVARSGDVEFVRFCQASNSIVRSGKMDRSIFPSWVTKFFASVHIDMDHVYSDTRISTKVPGPDHVRLKRVQECVFDSKWCVHE